MPTDTTAYSIHEASQAAGVTTSALRVWEQRYGWPKPTRRANAYRMYASGQVEEIKRVAALVRSGFPIGSLIVEGTPRWPSEASQPMRKLLKRTRALPMPTEPAEAALHRELLEAFEARRGVLVKEVLQRLFWTVRPQDEARVALVPAAMALTELRIAGKPLTETAELLDVVRDRCLQLLRMQHHASDAIAVVPARGGDQAVAALAAVLLSERGVPARPWAELSEPSGRYAVASDGPCPRRRDGRHVGTVTTLGEDGTTALSELLDRSKPMPLAVGEAAVKQGP